MRYVLALLFILQTLNAQTKVKQTNAPFYNFIMKTIDGKEKPLSDYRGKVIMAVNVASFCGNTPQYKDLEALYKKYKEKGFIILGFPANNFANQEPGSNEDIKKFCELNYSVTFDLFAKINVKGNDIHPLYKYLTKETGEDIGWNFTKFIIDKHGTIAGRYATKIKPDATEIVKKIELLLSEE